MRNVRLTSNTTMYRAQYIRLFTVCVLWVALCGMKPFKTAQLTINNQVISVEVAATSAERSEGLMHRRDLPANSGMLFIFPEPAGYSMWMKNTYIELSAAFIDKNGSILRIVDMVPGSEQLHFGGLNTLYVLETNQGWFKKNGIQEGDKIVGLDKLKW